MVSNGKMNNSMNKIETFLELFLIIILLAIFIVVNHSYTIIKPLFDFEQWMRKHKYNETIVQIYKCNYKNPLLRLIMLDYFKIAKGDLRRPKESTVGYAKFKSSKDMRLNFIEVIPTDHNIEFTTVDQNVIKVFNDYLKKRFGKNIAIDHIKIELDYHKSFGDILFNYNTMFDPDNPELTSFMERFEPPCMIKFDAEKIGSREVAQIWNIRHCAIIMGRDFRLIDRVDVFDKYAHEFAHNIGLDHQFIDPKNPPRSRVEEYIIEDNKGKYVGIDDIMIKSKEVENKVVGRYLSPLSRYVLEPVNGYEDDDEFGLVYNNLYTTKTLNKIKDCACK